MLYAIATMDPAVQAVFFIVAVILFVLAALVLGPWGTERLIAAGLAFGTFVFFWNALAQA